MAPAATDPVRAGGNAWRYLGYSLAVLAAMVGWRALDDAAQRHLFLINRTPSLPNWAFVVERGALPARGTVSFFRPPANPLVEAHFGKVPATFGKIAYGLPGDRVERVGPKVFVVPAGTERPFEVGVLKPVSSRGEPLAAGPTGIIPKGCYYMGSPHKDGFDSRYAAIGFICEKQIVGTASMVIL